MVKSLVNFIKALEVELKRTHLDRELAELRARRDCETTSTELGW